MPLRSLHSWRVEAAAEVNLNAAEVESEHSDLSLEQVLRLPGAEANGELKRRGHWPLTARRIVDRLGTSSDEYGGAIDHRFAVAYGNLALLSSVRTTMVTIAIKLCRDVLKLLNSDPDALWDAMASRLRPVTIDRLTSKQKSQVVAESKLSTALVTSFADARKREAPNPQLAQILSPLAAQYSLRVFNEAFELKLEGAPVKRHLWSLARTHLALWHAAQSAEPGGGHQRIRFSWETLQGCLRHIGEHLQVLAHGDRSLVLEDTNERLWVGRALLKSKPEDMYRDYVKGGGKAGRSVYLFACDQASCGSLKQLGALDVTAEIHGRQQFELLQKEVADEVASAYPLLAPRCTHIKGLIDRSHKHARCDLKRHVTTTSCCADHCLRCLFADPTGKDPSLPTPCDTPHTQLCSECREIDTLWAEFDGLFSSVASTLQASDQRGASQLDVWRKLTARARTRIEYYIAHELRLINEAQAMPRAIAALTDTSCIVIADYKQKFLPSVQRRPQSDLFALRGMAWHGMMCMRRPREGEYPDMLPGELVVDYLDQVLGGGETKEDAFTGLGCIQVGLQCYKELNPSIESTDLFTDAGNGYATAEFLIGLTFMRERTQIVIKSANVGEAGGGKTSLDANFATKGQALNRQTASGKKDINDARSLYDGLTMVAEKENTTVQLVGIDRSARMPVPKIAGLKGLSRMSERVFNYDEHGKFVSVRLHQQSGHGVGRLLTSRELFPGEHTPTPTAPSLLASYRGGAGSSADTTQPVAEGAQAPADAPPMLSRKPRGTAKTAEAIAAAKVAKAERQAKRDRERLTSQQRERARLVARLRQSNGMHCMHQTNGDPRCAFFVHGARARARMQNHIQSNTHFLCGAAPRSRATRHCTLLKDVNLNDRVKRGVADMLSKGGTHTVTAAMPNATAGVDTAELEFRLHDSSSLRVRPRAHGWARMRRLPRLTLSVSQLKFVHWALTVEERHPGKHIHSTDAPNAMRRFGTREYEAEYPGDEAARHVPGPDCVTGSSTCCAHFSRLDILERRTFLQYAGKQAGPSHVCKLIAKAEARGGVIDAEDDDDGDDDGQGGGRTRKRGGAQGADGTADKRQRASSEIAIDASVDATTLIKDLATRVSGVQCWAKCAPLLHDAVTDAGHDATAQQLARADDHLAQWRATAAAAAPDKTRLPGLDKLKALSAKLVEHLRLDDDADQQQEAGAAEDGEASEVDWGDDPEAEVETGEEEEQDESASASDAEDESESEAESEAGE